MQAGEIENKSEADRPAPKDAILIVEDMRAHWFSFSRFIDAALAEKNITNDKYEILVGRDMEEAIDHLKNPNYHIRAAIVDNGFPIWDTQKEPSEEVKKLLERLNETPDEIIANDADRKGRISSNKGETAGPGTELIEFLRTGRIHKHNCVYEALKTATCGLAISSPGIYETKAELKTLQDTIVRAIRPKYSQLPVIFCTKDVNEPKIAWIRSACSGAPIPKEEIDKLDHEAMLKPFTTYDLQGNVVNVPSDRYDTTLVADKNYADCAKIIASHFTRELEHSQKPDLTNINGPKTDIQSPPPLEQSHGRSQTSTQ